MSATMKRIRKVSQASDVALIFNTMEKNSEKDTITVNTFNSALNNNFESINKKIERLITATKNIETETNKFSYNGYIDNGSLKNFLYILIRVLNDMQMQENYINAINLKLLNAREPFPNGKEWTKSSYKCAGKVKLITCVNDFFVISDDSYTFTTYSVNDNFINTLIYIKPEISDNFYSKYNFNTTSYAIYKNKLILGLDEEHTRNGNCMPYNIFTRTIDSPGLIGQSSSNPYNYNSISVNAILYNNKNYINIATNQGIITFENDTTFKSHSSQKYNFNCLAFGNSTWVAGTNISSGTKQGMFYTSTGYTWSQCDDLATVNINNVIFVDGKFIAGTDSGVYFSNTGNSWSKCPISGNYTVKYINGIYFIIGTITCRSILSYKDINSDINAKCYIDINGSQVNDILYVGDKYLIATDTGIEYVLQSELYDMLETDDPAIITTETTNLNLNVTAIGYGHGIILAGTDDGTLYYSKSWE